MVFTRTRTQLGIPLLGRKVGRQSEVITHTEAGAPMPASASVAQEIARIKAINNFHRSLGWGGFGYQAAVCQSGRAYEGRGAGRSGAHTVNQNSKPAIVVLGHGDRTPMSIACQRAHRMVQGHWIKSGFLVSSPKVTGHRDYARKSCPGNLIYPQLPLLRGVTFIEEKIPGLPTDPPPVEPERTWFDMASRKDLEDVIDSRIPAIAQLVIDRLMQAEVPASQRGFASLLRSGGFRLDELRQPHMHDQQVVMARVEELLREFLRRDEPGKVVTDPSTVFVARTDVDEGLAKVAARLTGANYVRYNVGTKISAETLVLVGSAGNLAGATVAPDALRVIRLQGRNRVETAELVSHFIVEQR